MRKNKGTWKVAYADFVTAMMIFFLLMWLVSNIGKEDLKKVSEYFSQQQDESAASADNKELLSEQSVRDNHGSTKSLRILLQSLQSSDLAKEFSDNIEIYWNNGVVIDLKNSKKRPLFFAKNDKLYPCAIDVIYKVASLVKDHGKYFVIEGNAASHSDYDAWDLSFRRANKVREVLLSRVNKGQVLKVVGNGDKDLLDPHDVLNPINTRVSLIVLDELSINKRHASMPPGI
ncbi:flagellar motor protein MotB [Candidatus Sneabacter namystus]|uniref:OmpA family protein n=1 Tax=Candidatus Sneabacter namystus TaxID=2601646 RepID=A0A5C0UJB7_9RICK|nr:flagellar motor protein MotB [Candidatus Sneabacter namystus]QEK39603.1 OmpA family protein [Candidatus Sneabacter namystus]